LRAIREAGTDIGAFGADVYDFEGAVKGSSSLVGQSALQTNGGSFSSYLLVGVKQTKNNPNLQLYYDPNWAAHIRLGSKLSPLLP